MILVTSTYGCLIGNHSSVGMTSRNVPLPKRSIPQCLDKQMGSLPTAPWAAEEKQGGRGAEPEASL